jgi:hypothetical protein
MARGALGHGCGEVGEGGQGDAELADQGLNQEGSGRDAPRLGGPGCGALDGLEALGHDVGGAPMMGGEEARAGSAARERHGFEGRPWGEEVAEAGGVCVVEPLADMGEVVVQGTGEAIREPYVVADQTTAMVDEWFEGA